MTSNRAYLVRALFDWIIDNTLSPYLLVDASTPQAVVPQQFVEDQKIVLNISPSATSNLVLGNDAIAFNARFSGQPMNVSFPIDAVMAIYAKENGQGMMFAKEDATALLDNETESDPEPKPPTPPASKRPTLKVVK
ncbi:MAG: ClpXP protease specificity-enhancing factor [Gammaproteobacteria bacterium]|nr:ClpXP protease specificity-enhancing factor [Gammaproteobacteria bacterium]